MEMPLGTSNPSVVQPLTAGSPEPARAQALVDRRTELLRHYTYDVRLGRDVTALIAVKNLTQGQKNRERLDRLRRGIPRIGASTVRPAEEGIVCVCRLSEDILSDRELAACVSLDDPIGVDVSGSRLAISSRDRVLVFEMRDRELQVFEDPWFAALHSVAFSPDGTRLLVASSGYDTIFELAVDSGEVLWEWNAWEHGFSLSATGDKEFSRNGRSPSGHEPSGKQLVHVDPSRLRAGGVPIWQRAVHLNGAAYDRDGSVLATLFHHGKAVKIEAETKACEEIISGLSKPHAFLLDPLGGYLVTSSGGGDAQSLLLDGSFDLRQCISPAGLPGMREGFPEGEEWLQYATCLEECLYCLVDIHRSSLFLVDPAKRTYRRITFPRDWAVQMVIGASGDLRLPPQRLLPRR